MWVWVPGGNPVPVTRAVKNKEKKEQGTLKNPKNRRELSSKGERTVPLRISGIKCSKGVWTGSWNFIIN